jgi:hypothetical protein
MSKSGLEHLSSIAIIVLMLPFTLRAYGWFPFSEKTLGKYIGVMPKNIAVIIKVCGPLVILYELFRIFSSN